MVTIYQVFVKLEESRNSYVYGPLSYASAEDRLKAVTETDRVFWYHFAEEEDWHLWKRGGAWEATQQPGPADKVPDPPEITEDDRW